MLRVETQHINPRTGEKTWDDISAYQIEYKVATRAEAEEFIRMLSCGDTLTTDGDEYTATDKHGFTDKYRVVDPSGAGTDTHN